MMDEYEDPIVEEATTPAEPVEVDEGMDETSAKKWRARITTAKKRTKDYLDEWTDNVDYRRGKPFESTSDQDRIAVNLDWPNTKAKQAQLFSQLPALVLQPLLKDVPTLAAAVPVFGRELNEELKRAGAEAAMDECLPDVINAAGVAAAMCWYESKSEMVALPTVGREMVAGLSDEEYQIAVDNDIIPSEQVERVMDARFRIKRLSPSKLLWDRGFKGSDFNDANWVGHWDRLTWAEAKSRFTLADEEKEALSGASNAITDTLSRDEDGLEDEDRPIEYTELFYWRYRYHADEKNFKAIQHVVFVEGKDDPVIDEPWKGQKLDEESHAYVGSCIFPIQFCTLTYLSDEAVPPSDSAIGRPQVDELIESRSQMVLQRRHSQPMRWMNANLVDPLIQDAIQRGVYQGFIPVNGDGSRIIGEVARAQYPSENFGFDKVAKEDNRESWQVGANQAGTVNTGETSAAEASIVQQNFQTRIGYERQRVTKFYVRIAEVLGGLMALYGKFELPDVSPTDMQRLQGWDRTRIANYSVYSVRTDSSVLLDANQRFDKLKKFLSIAGPSGFVDVEPILREMAELSGMDPDTTVKKPEPKGIDPANLSFRFGGAEDLMNPMVVGVMIKSGLAPTPQEVEAAKAIILAANGMLPGGPGTGPPGPPSTAEQPPNPGDGVAGWDTMPRIDTRRAEGETGE